MSEITITSQGFVVKMTQPEYETVTTWLKEHEHNRNVQEAIRISQKLNAGVTELFNWSTGNLVQQNSTVMRHK